MGLSTFVTMLIGFARAKFLAVSLGPDGVGIFSQAVTFFQSVEALCGLGISLGITKYVSEAWKSRSFNGVKNIVVSSLRLQSFSFILFFMLAALFSCGISRFVFSSAEYAWPVVMLSSAVIFSIFLISIESVLLGMGRADIFSSARIVYTVAGLLVLMIAVSFAKVTGAIVYIALNAVLALAVTAYFLIRVFKKESGRSLADITKRFFKADRGENYSSKLISYGAVMLTVSTISWFSILIVRSILIKNGGASDNGLFQVAFALVSYYTPFFTNGVWGYLFPRLSAIKKAREFNVEINKTLRFILLFLTPSVIIVFLLKRVLVLLIFSKEFMGSLEIFPLYLLGSFLFLISYILGTAFLAKKSLKIYLTINITQSILYVLVFALLVPRLGLLAIAVSYLFANIVSVAASGLYQALRMGLKISAQNFKLFVLSISFILFVFFASGASVISYGLNFIFLAAWAMFVVGKREKALLLSFIRNRKS